MAVENTAILYLDVSFLIKVSIALSDKINLAIKM